MRCKNTWLSFNNRLKDSIFLLKNLRNLQFNLICKIQNAQKTLLQFLASYNNSEHTKPIWVLYAFKRSKYIHLVICKLKKMKEDGFDVFWRLKINKCENMWLFFNNRHTIFTLSATTKVEKARIHFVLQVSTNQKSYKTHMVFYMFLTAVNIFI